MLVALWTVCCEVNGKQLTKLPLQVLLFCAMLESCWWVYVSVRLFTSVFVGKVVVFIAM